MSARAGAPEPYRRVQPGAAVWTRRTLSPAPVRTIDGFSAAVMEDEAGRLSPDGMTALRTRTAAQTLARLLDGLMGLWQVSRRELLRSEVDLTALALEVGEETAADHSSQLGQFEGDGVGLAIVRRLVRRYGGQVWAESPPGAGTTIYFTLPDGRAE